MMGRVLGVAVLLLGVGLLAPAQALSETIELINGDKLEVTILERTEFRVVAEHPVLGRIEIPVSEIKPPDAPTPPNPGLFGTSFMEGFTRAFSLGLAGSSGVTEELNLNTDFAATFESETRRQNFVLRYYIAKARQTVDKIDGNGNMSTNSTLENTNNEFEARYLHDFLISDSKWFFYGAGAYKYDEFQEWDHRIVVSGGVGYDFLRTDTWTLSGRAGPGYTRLAKGDDKDEANAVIAMNVEWKVFEGQSVTASTNYLPILTDTPEFRSLSRLEWKIATGIVRGLGVKIGGSYEYISTNEGNNNDRKYYANIVYDF